jgi:aryl-alcohol dehydrogenase-like predicted oxidoreductase
VKYRRLGRTGFNVSEIGHGLWGMSNWTGSDDAESAAALQLSADLGCNFFDSAWAYGKGKSDRMLGQLLRNNPGKRLYAASKIPPKNWKWPAVATDDLNDVFPEGHVLRYTEEILKTMQVSCLDLLQFHVWHDRWAEDETWMRTVRRLKEERLITAFGISVNRWEPANVIRALRTGCVDTVQVIYNIFDQAPEDELFPVCEELDIGVIARVPLDEGSLAGTLTLSTTFPANDWRASYFNPQNLRATVERVEALRKLVPAGSSLVEMALRFILSCPTVDTTIVGMRKTRHVEANMKVSDGVPLDKNLLAELRRHRWDRQPTQWSS